MIEASQGCSCKGISPICSFARWSIPLAVLSDGDARHCSQSEKRPSGLRSTL